MKCPPFKRTVTFLPKRLEQVCDRAFKDGRRRRLAGLLLLLFPARIESPTLLLTHQLLAQFRPLAQNEAFQSRGFHPFHALNHVSISLANFLSPLAQVVVATDIPHTATVCRLGFSSLRS